MGMSKEKKAKQNTWRKPGIEGNQLMPSHIDTLEPICLTFLVLYILYDPSIFYPPDPAEGSRGGFSFLHI